MLGICCSSYAAYYVEPYSLCVQVNRHVDCLSPASVVLHALVTYRYTWTSCQERKHSTTRRPFLDSRLWRSVIRLHRYMAIPHHYRHLLVYLDMQCTIPFPTTQERKHSKRDGPGRTPPPPSLPIMECGGTCPLEGLMTLRSSRRSPVVVQNGFDAVAVHHSRCTNGT